VLKAVCLPEAIGIPLNEQEESKRATEGLPGLGALYSLLVGQALGQAVSFLT
jgi:hypothetical protein